MFKVKFSKQSVKFLKNSNKELTSRIFSKIEILKKEPISHDSKPVQGFKDKLFRVRIGNYRILYEVDNKNNLIGIVKIDKRSKAY